MAPNLNTLSLVFWQILPYFGTLLILVAYFGLGTARGQRLGRYIHHRLHRTAPLLLFFPYLFAARFQITLADAIRFGIAIYLPVLFFRRVKGYRRFNIWLALTLLAIWFPLEPHLFLLPFGKAGAKLATWLAMPSIPAPIGPGLTLPLEKLTMVVIALYLFTVRMPLADLGFTWRLSRGDLWEALSDIVLFAIVGIPIGLFIHFLHFHIAVASAVKIVLAAIGMYFFVALPEEIFFRGLLQNLLQRHWKHRRSRGLWVAALIFGLAHIDNATPGFPVPNFAYVLMATIAGLIYGSTWARTQKVSASALTHAGVNLLWLVFFH